MPRAVPKEPEPMMVVFMKRLRTGEELVFFLFREAIFGAVAEALNVRAMLPDCEDCDYEAEDK